RARAALPARPPAGAERLRPRAGAPPPAPRPGPPPAGGRGGRPPAPLRRARPGLGLTPDLIVGFPGESEDDFRATLALVREIGFVDSYSFKYSPRPGPAAAGLPDPASPGPPHGRAHRRQ